eukprot:GHUV01045214.1.p1 GENE.GHUV01045214.1~~GHUV01045214.1.p1  ORF type:complete len:179 (-),score=22.86 GHUV01045214.1:45-581(-)
MVDRHLALCPSVLTRQQPLQHACWANTSILQQQYKMPPQSAVTPRPARHMHGWYIHSRVCRFIESGGVFKLEFGPKAFIVVSDPVVVRHLLKVMTAAAVGTSSLASGPHKRQSILLQYQHTCSCIGQQQRGSSRRKSAVTSQAMRWAVIDCCSLSSGTRKLLAEADVVCYSVSIVRRP